MNRNFKVVFSKARGALMVVNEATSSIQAKGTKTVIAAAIAAVAGSAMAASAYVEAPTKPGDDVAIFDAASSDDKLKAENSFVLTAKDTDTTTPLLSPKDNYTLTADKKIWVTGVGAKAHASGIWMDTADKTATNESTIYVTTGKDGKYYANRAMGVNKGKIVNKGTIVAKNAYGMTVGSTGGTDTTAVIINGVNGKIIVEDQGVGIELGGSSNDGSNQTKATAQNYGEIYAGKPAQEDSYIAAVQIKGGDKASSDQNTLLAGQIFKNEASGKIYAADATAAIYDNLTTGAKIENLGLIEGDVIVGEKATGTEITLGTTSVLTGDIQVSGTNTKIDLSKDAVTTGDIVNTGTGTTINATTDNGKVSTLTGSILAKGGDITQSGNLKAESVVVGTLKAGETDATSGTYTVAGGAKLAVESATVNTGTLNVAGELTTGELTTVKTTGAASVTGTLSAGKITNAGTLTLGNNGTVKVTGTGSVNKGSIVKAESASGDTFEVTKGADFTNEADAVMGADKQHLSTIKVAEGATLKNSGLIYVDTLTVNGTVDTGMFVTKSATDTTLVNHLKFETLTLNDGAKFNMSAYPEVTGAEKTFTFTDGTLNLNGGQFYVKDALVDDTYALVTGTNSTVNVGGGAYAYKSLKVGGTANLKDGTVAVADLDASAGTVTIDGGSLTVTKTIKTKESAFTIGQDGTLAVAGSALGFKADDEGAVSFTKATGYNTITNNGMINVDGVAGSMKAADLTKALSEIASTQSNGLVALGALTVSDVTVDDKGTVGYDKISGLGNVALDQFANATVTGVNGTLGGSYGALALAESGAATASGTLVLNNSGTLVADSKGKVAGITVANGSTLVTTGDNAVIGAIKKGTDASDTVVRVDAGSLSVEGDIDVATLTVDGKLSMTEKAAAKEGEDPTPYTITTRNLEVGETGALNVQHDVNLYAGTGDAQIAGSAVIEGTLKSINFDNNNAIRTVYVGDKNNTGSLAVGKLENIRVFADPSWESGKEAAQVAVKELASSATVQAGQNSIVALGTMSHAEAVQAVADSGFVVANAEAEGAAKNAVNSVVYVTGTSTTNTTTGAVTYSQVAGGVLADNATKADTTFNGVTIAKNSLLVLDVANLDKTGEQAVFSQGVELKDGAKLYLGNIANGQTIKLTDQTFTSSNSSTSATVFYDGDLLMDTSFDKTNGVVSVSLGDRSDLPVYGLNGAGFDVIYAMYENGENVGNDNAKFFRDLFTKNSSIAYEELSNGESELNISKVNTILNDVAAIGTTTGAQAVTMDAVNQMADTVAARTSVLTQRAQGVNVWVDVNGGRFEGKKVMDGAGYSSDIYAGTLGADYQFANGAVLGAALTIGTADTDSKGTTAKTSMDSDLVGFSVYGSKTFADIWNVAGDIGYLQASNDVTESGYGFGDFSEDVNAFTLGVRGEVLTKAGSVNIVPHLGLRYTRLSTDSFKAGFNTEIDDQNIFQMPVGVTVSADFETSGWTIAPKFDLSVVPTFGDKDADLKLGISGVSASDDLSVRVIDSNPVQATLGVSATNGAWGFGLNYKLGVGSDDRMNNSFNANVRYAF